MGFMEEAMEKTENQCRHVACFALDSPAFLRSTSAAWSEGANLKGDFGNAKTVARGRSESYDKREWPGQ